MTTADLTHSERQTLGECRSPFYRTADVVIVPALGLLLAVLTTDIVFRVIDSRGVGISALVGLSFAAVWLWERFWRARRMRQLVDKLAARAGV